MFISCNVSEVDAGKLEAGQLINATTFEATPDEKGPTGKDKRKTKPETTQRGKAPRRRSESSLRCEVAWW